MVAARRCDDHAFRAASPGGDTDGVITALTRFAGLVLRAGFALILLVRRPRPIHSRGVVLEGEIRWMPRAHDAGIPWIDQVPGTVARTTARVSRSIGLPAPLPDVIGLALRVGESDAPADLELASTGVGVPGRFLLFPHRSPVRATLSTLLPYRGSRGPVLIAARTVAASVARGSAGISSSQPPDPWTLRLYAAVPTGRWHPFAEVTLRLADDQDDTALRFDAVRHPLPGAGTYEWTRLLRQPSYRLVQRDRPDAR